MAVLGVVALILSVAVNGAVIAAAALAIRREDNRLLNFARFGVYANFFFLLAALIGLLTLLGRTDLSVVYVANHSSATTEPFYKFSSLWAGSSGSYLLWNFLNSFFSAAFVFIYRRRPIPGMAHSILVLAVIGGFFSFINTFFQDAMPFANYTATLPVGRGLNPLLLHWAMIIHPPILYLGYVSFSVPFAIAMGALMAGKVDAAWLKVIRRWAIFSWFFLGAGIILGMKWAYEELGWGGYWAWDPVENASLMPWLLSTAFIHSIIVQERRGMLKVWNMTLMLLTWHFCLLGTWITRSGVLEGPHSFAESSFGTPFFFYILISGGVFGTLVYRKRKLLKPERNLESLTSKESSFLLNNLILLSLVLLIMFGVFNEAATKFLNKWFSSEIPVTILKEAWYNSWAVPMGLVVILLMGLGPLLAWRRSSARVWIRNVLPVGLLGLVGFFLAPLFLRPFEVTPTGYLEMFGKGLEHWYAYLAWGLVFFSVGGVLLEMYRGFVSRRQRFGASENPFASFVRFITRNKRRYGGYLVHVGMALMFLGFTGKAVTRSLKMDFDLPFQGYSDKARRGMVKAERLQLPGKLAKVPDTENPEKANPAAARNTLVYGGTSGGDKIVLGPWQFQMVRLLVDPRYPVSNLEEGRLSRNHETDIVLSADVVLYKGTQPVKHFYTTRIFHPRVDPFSAMVSGSQPSSHPSIYATFPQDVYVQLGAVYDPKKDINPDLEKIARKLNFEKLSGAGSSEILSQIPENVRVTLRVWVNPLVQVIWLGSILMVLSGLVILIPVGEGRKKQ